MESTPASEPAARPAGGPTAATRFDPWLLAPSLLVLGTFVIYPLFKSVWLGHQRCDNAGKRCRSNGWDQYVDVFRSTDFQHALGVTVKFALLTVPTGLVLGLMPHPENHVIPRQHPMHRRGGGGRLGLRLFEAGVRHAREL